MRSPQQNKSLEYNFGKYHSIVNPVYMKHKFNLPKNLKNSLSF
jgi:hypothetical protein